MTPREIIAEAWAITRRTKPLRQWGIFSSFLETLLSVKLLSYQFYFLYEELYSDGTGGFFDVEILIYQSMPFWFFVTFVTFFTVLLIIEFFVPHMATGAIIGLGARAYRKEETKGGLLLALSNFFPIFAIHELFVLSSLTNVITISSVVWRYIEGDVRYVMIGGLLFFWVLSVVLKFFSSFAEEAVVIHHLGIFNAVGKSFRLIISYLSHVMFLLLLLFVISLRILINTVLVLVVPGTIIGLAILLSTFLSPWLSYLIASLVGTALIAVASYFFGYLHVFRQTVWTLTYLELSGKKELDQFD